jgi:hypothetical protein
VAAQFRGLGSRPKEAPQLLSRQFQQELVDSKADPIDRQEAHQNLPICR